MATTEPTRPAPSRWRLGRIKLALLGCGGLLLVCLLFGIVSAIADQNRSSPATKSATVTPQPTAVAVVATEAITTPTAPAPSPTQVSPTATTEAPVATATPEPADTPTPEPAELWPALDGPRLGATRQDWIDALGSPSRGIIGDTFRNGAEAAFRDGADGSTRAWHVEVMFPNPVSINDARAATRRFLPEDAEPVRTYRAAAGQTAEVFHSESLAEAFSNPSPMGGPNFGDAEPGTFIRIAERGEPQTSRVVIGIGDNP